MNELNTAENAVPLTDSEESNAPRRESRLSRLQRENAEPWGRFLLRIAVKTSIVLAVGSVVVVVVSALVK